MVGRKRDSIVVSVVVVVLILMSVATLGATDAYSLEATPGIDTPTRTVSTQVGEYQVSSFGHVDQGSSVEIEVTRPGDDDFQLYFYDKDGNHAQRPKRGYENGTFSFETGSLERGSYVVALYHNDDYQQIQPVVIDGYDFSVDAPSEVQFDESVSITIELTGDTTRPYYVDVAVMNDSVHRYTATRVDDRTYNVIINDLAPDDYRLYAGARGKEEVNGEDELLGISAVQPLTVQGDEQTTTTEPQTTTESTTTADSNGAGTETSGSTTSTNPTTTTPTTETTIPENTTTELPTSHSNTTPVTNSTTEQTTVVTATSNSTQATTTTNETAATTPIQPATTSPTDSTPTSTPGFTLVTTILALVGSLLLVSRRQ